GHRWSRGGVDYRVDDSGFVATRLRFPGQHGRSTSVPVGARKIKLCTRSCVVSRCTVEPAVTALGFILSARQPRRYAAAIDFHSPTVHAGIHPAPSTTHARGLAWTIPSASARSARTDASTFAQSLADMAG